MTTKNNTKFFAKRCIERKRSHNIEIRNLRNIPADQLKVSKSFENNARYLHEFSIALRFIADHLDMFIDTIDEPKFERFTEI